MFRKHVPAPIQMSPAIFRFSPEELTAAADVSFEAYKQQGPRKRSISPMINEQFMRSPNISPIELNRAFRMSPRNNTPKCATSANRDRKQPAKPRFLGESMNLSSSFGARDKSSSRSYLLNTPLAKRQLEHRVSVRNILKDINLPQYLEIFVREEIDFEVFLTLSEQDLHDIGIHCQRDIELILAKVAEYNSCV